MQGAPAAVRDMPLRWCSSPPIDLKCAPVRQWKEGEWEDQLGSDPSGFVTAGKPF